MGTRRSPSGWALALLALAGSDAQRPGQPGFSWPVANSSGVLLLGASDLGFAGPGQPSFYTLQFNTSRELHVSLTPMSGDVDLFFSAVVPRPDAASYAAGNSTMASAHEGYSEEGLVIAAGSLCKPQCPSSVYLGVSAPPGHSALYVLTATEVDVHAESGGSITSLTAGQPLDGSLREGARAHYAFVPPDGEADVVIRLTVTTSGDPDVFVSSGPPLGPEALQRKSDWPTPDGATWAADSFGSDQLVIPQAKGCGAGPCAYYITVLAYAATGYQIEALQRAARQTVTLRASVPYQSTLEADEFAFFAFPLLPDAPPGVLLTLTSFAGDADLYASFNDTRPGAGSLGSDVWMSNSAGEDDRIRIDGEAVPKPLPATLYIGVTAYGEPAEFTLVASAPGGGTPTVLVPGQPQRGSVLGGDHAWFTFTPGAGVVTFTLTPQGGDPDLFVSPLPGFQAEDRWMCADPLFGAPTCAASILSPGAVDVVTIGPGSPIYCTQGQCVYKVLVVGASSASFTLTAQVEAEALPDKPATSQVPVTTLITGTPTIGSVDTGEYAFYRVPISRLNASITVSLTRLSGDPDLYASFLTPRPTAADANFSSAEMGDDRLFLSHFLPSFCERRSGICELRIGVSGYRNSTFTLTVTQDDEARLSLVNGLPQRGVLEDQQWQYYSFDVQGGADLDEIQISITAEYGDPDVFVRACPAAGDRQARRDGCALPFRGDPEGWSGTRAGAEELRVSATTGSGWCGNCSYTIGVVGFTRSAYTITATTGSAASRSTVTLIEGVPTRATVGEDEYRYFVLSVDPSLDIYLSLTAATGDPDLYASFSSTAPSRSDFQFSATAASEEDGIHIKTSELGFCPRGTPCLLAVAVFGFSASSFSISAVQQLDGPVALLDGVPLAVGALGVGEWRYFAFSVGAFGAASTMLLREGVSCSAPDQALGSFPTLGGCAGACEALPGCRHFTYSKAGAQACVAEWTAGHTCPEGFVPSPVDFYALTPATGGFTVSVSPTMGDPDLYINAGTTPPSASAFHWRAVSSGADALRIDSTDARWCGRCSYIIGVLAPQLPSGFSIVASTRGAATVLNDGRPQLRSLPPGVNETFLVYVPGAELQDGHVGVSVLATAISGSVSIYASAAAPPTNASFTWRSDDRIGGARLDIPWHDVALSTCLMASPVCLIYVTAASADGATFTLLASLDRPDSGVHLAIASLLPQPARLLWSEAEAECAATSGGHLASIQSEADNGRFLAQCVAAAAAAAPGSAEGCWLGLTDARNESVWEWSDGSPLRYTNWAPGEPNGQAGETTDAAYMYVGSFQTGKWDDTWGERQGERRPAVCRSVAARPYFFGGAAFGPPLPFEPLSVRVAAAVPSDACQPVGAAVAGRAALVTRGNCDFVVKARNVQQAGGLAMIVANNRVGGVVRMIAGANDPSDITIPSVLLMMSDADELSAALEHPDSKEAVLTLRQPGTKAVALTPGVPQQGQLPPLGAAVFSLTVSRARRVLISVSSTSAAADVDLFVSTDGSTPTTTHFTFAATRAGSDLLLLRAGDEGFVGDGDEPGTFLIGVFNAQRSDASFTLVASTGETVTMLPAGTPLYSLAALGTPALFRYQHQPPATSPSAALQMSLAALSGNPDLCVSRNGTALAAALPHLNRSDRVADRQSAMDATAAFRASMSEHCTWWRTADGSDSLTIQSTDPRGGGDGWYYAAVFTSDAASRFTFTSRVVDTTPVPLAPGQPLSADAVAGGWAFFALDLGANASVATVRLLLSPSLGSPDMFVRLLRPGDAPSLPTRDAIGGSDFALTGGASPLTLERMQLGGATFLLIGVSDVDVDTAFTLTAAVELVKCDGSGDDADLCPGDHRGGKGGGGGGGHDSPALPLMPARPTVWSSAGDGPSYTRFEYAVGSVPQPLDLTLTPMPGGGAPWRRPKLVASFSDASPSLNSHAFPRPGDYAAAFEAAQGTAARDRPEETHYRLHTGRCKAVGAPLGQFGTVGECAAACRAHVRPAGGASGCFYFSYGKAGACNASYAASAACTDGFDTGGETDFYSLAPPLLGATSLRLSAAEASPVVCSGSAGGCVLHVAVLCDGPPCGYGLVAAPANALIQLQSGLPQRGARAAAEWGFYSVRIPRGAGGLSVTVGADAGQPAVCVVETRAHDGQSGEAAGDDEEDRPVAGVPRVPGACAAARPMVGPPGAAGAVLGAAARDVWFQRGAGTLFRDAASLGWCDGCDLVLAVASPEAATAYTLTVTIVWRFPVAPTAGGSAGTVLLLLFLLGAAAAGVVVCRRRYTRGQPLLPGFLKNPAAYLPSMPRFGGGGGRAQVGPTGSSRAVGGRRGMRMLDGAQELRSYDAPLVAAEVGMPIGPRPGLVGSPLLGDSTPVRGTGTYTAPTPGPAALTPSSMGLFTPGDPTLERSGADVSVEPLRAGLACSSTHADAHRV